MNLVEYPGYNTSRVGVHWSPSPTQWGQRKWWTKYDPWLQATHMQWVKANDDGGGSAMGLVKRLLYRGIIPVVRLYRHKPYPGAIGGREVETVKRYVDLGVVYFEPDNEPDSEMAEWHEPMPSDWLNIVVRDWVSNWSRIKDVGGIALFPAFSFGGGRDDPYQILASIAPEAFEHMGVGLHNYGLGRPLTYPNDVVSMTGVPLSLEDYNNTPHRDWAWEVPLSEINKQRRERANPGATIYGDYTCFRAFEKYDHQIRKACGHSVPIFMTEGGYNVGERAPGDCRYPRPTPAEMSRLTLEMFNYPHPDYLFGLMPWIVGVGDFGVTSIPFEAQGPWFGGWYDKQFGLSGEMPIVHMLKQPEPRPPKPDPMWDGVEVLNKDCFFTDHPPVLAKWPGPHWVLQTVGWNSEGRGNVYVRTRRGGDWLPQIAIVAQWPGGGARSFTKTYADNLGFGDLPVPGVPTTVSVEGPSDKITVLEGTYFLSFEWSEGEKPVFDYKKYLAGWLNQTLPFNDAIDYGVSVEFNTDQPVFSALGVHHLLSTENDSNHVVHLDVVDEDGNRIPNAVVHWTWEGRRPEEPAPPLVLSKPEVEPAGNLPVYLGQNISVWLEDSQGKVISDTVVGLQTGLPDEPPGNQTGHHSFYVVFQRQAQPDPVPVPDPIPDPTPDPEPGEWEAKFRKAGELYQAYSEKMDELFSR